MLIRFYEIVSSHPQAQGMRYIGRTKHPIEERFKLHVYHAKYDKGRNGALQVAMRSLGYDTFSVRLIEEGEYEDQNDIDHRELELIVQHDSIRKGWNRYTSSAPRRRVEEKGGTIMQRWERIRALVSEGDRLIPRTAKDHRVALRHALRQLSHEAGGLVRAMVLAQRARNEASRR